MTHFKSAQKQTLWDRGNTPNEIHLFSPMPTAFFFMNKALRCEKVTTEKAMPKKVQIR